MPMSCSNVINSLDYKSALQKKKHLRDTIHFNLPWFQKGFYKVYYLFGQVILNESKCELSYANISLFQN